MVFDTVTSLVDKSLLTAQERAGVMRYGMLESIRAYGSRRLDEACEWPVMTHRHLAWLIDLVDHADPDGPAQAEWLDLIGAEIDNLMAGLERALDRRTESHDPDLALILAGRLARFWTVRGPIGVGRRWLDTALGVAGSSADPRRRAEALDAAGELASLQADQEASLAYQQRSLEIWRDLGDDAKVSSCLGDLGSVAHVRGEYQLAEARYTEALELAVRVGDDKRIARSLSGLGRLAIDRDDLVKATEYYEESLTRFRAAGDLRRATVILGNLGVVATFAGNTDLARARLSEHLANARLLGDRKLIGGALTNLGSLLFITGDRAEAKALQGEAAELGELIGDPRLTGVALTNLGILACADGDYEAAKHFHRRGLALAAKVGESRAVAECLEEMAVAESTSACHERAARLLGAAGAIRAEIGTPIPRSDVRRIETAAVASELALGAERFAAEHAAGGAMTRAQLLDYASGRQAISSSRRGCSSTKSGQRLGRDDSS
jgi:tetratricopeptide (TPR) repeat protein